MRLVRRSVGTETTSGTPALRFMRGVCHSSAAARWVCAVFFLTVASAAGAAQSLALKYYQHVDGLTNLSVTALAIDDRDRLWIGTENGLFRNDGDRVSSVSQPRSGLADRKISALVADSESDRSPASCTLWIGTAGGLWRSCLGAWIEARDGGKAIPIDDGTSMVADGTGAVLVISEGRLLRVQASAGDPSKSLTGFSVQRIAADVPSLQFFSILRVSEKHAWSGCATELCEWQGRRFMRYGVAQGVPKGRWAGLLQARDGSIWARSDAVVIRRRNGSKQFEDVTPRGLSNGTVHVQLPMLEDSEGRILVHTDDGLVRTTKGAVLSWQHFGESDNLTVAGGIHAMVFDSDGDLWLGTAGSGLAHWRGYRHWESWTRAQGLPSDDIWSFLGNTDGSIWIGTGAGVVLLDSQGIHSFAGPAASRHQVGSMISDASGQLWASTFSGHLLRLRRDRQTPVWEVIGETLPLVYGLIGVQGDELVAGTHSGLFEVDQASTRIPSVKRVTSAHDTDIRAMCTSTIDGSVWMGTDKGLLRRSASGVIDKPDIEGLPAQLVETLACGGSELWLTSSDDTLWQLQRTAGNWRAQSVTTPTLDHRRVVSLLIDHARRLWLGTDDGLIVRKENGDWRRFDDSNGLVWGDANGFALYEDSSNRIWIGTSRGVSRIDDPSTLLAGGSMQFSLDEVRQGARHWRPNTVVTIPSSREPIDIELQLRGFANRASTVVRYRFGGEEQAWLEADSSVIRFNELAAGNHHLEVYAQNIDLGWRSRVESVDLEILPPRWWSRAAQLGYAAALLVCVWLFSRWRVLTLLRRQKELQTEVRRRTQELEASHSAMRKLALTDTLTGIMNRGAVLDSAQREVERVRRGEGTLTLAMLDIDYFKVINDTYGHLAGDKVLRELAARLRSETRVYDLLGRYGGEEFLIVLPGLHIDRDDAALRLSSLRESVGGTPFVLEQGDELSVTCSMGATSAESGEQVTLATLIDAADRALYLAKKNGRNRVETMTWHSDASNVGSSGEVSARPSER